MGDKGKGLPFVTKAEGFIEVRTPEGLFKPQEPLLNGGGKPVATVWEMAESFFGTYGERRCLGVREYNQDGKTEKEMHGEFMWISNAEALEVCGQVGSSLAHMGAKKGELCVVLSCNTPEYMLAVLGSARQGCVPVPLPFSCSAMTLVNVLRLTNPRVVMCNAVLLERFVAACAELKRESVPLSVKAVVIMPSVPGCDVELSEEYLDEQKELYKWRVFLWPAFLRAGKKHPKPVVLSTSDDPFVVMQTSGSTGDAKSVVLSNRAVLAACEAMCAHPALAEFPDTKELSQLCICALSQVSSLVSTLAVMRIGGATGFPSLPTAAGTQQMADMKKLHPTLAVTVPQVWEVGRQVAKDVALGGNVLERRVMKHSLGKAEKDGKLHAFDSVIASSMRSRIGGRIRTAFVGGAHLSPTLLTWIAKGLVIPPLQGYGQTEYAGCGVVCTEPAQNTSTDVCPSTSSGYCWPGTTVRMVSVAGDPRYSIANNPPTGELFLQAASMFDGYFGDPETTEEVLDAEGWFRTGDVGQLNADGTLSIIDRLSGDYKLSSGRFANAAMLNGAYGLSTLCRHVFTYANKACAFMVAVVDVDVVALDGCAMLPSSARDAAAKARANPKSNAVKKLLELPEIVDLFLREFHRIAAENAFSPSEIVRGVVLDTYEWTAENGLLTPTGKLCQSELLRRYQDKLDKLVDQLLADDPQLIAPLPIEDEDQP